MKVDEIIESALRKIQVTAPSANEKADAMEALNDIRKELFSGGKQGQHAITVDTHTLTVSTGSYTIGTGATIDTLRPSHIEAVFVVQNDIGYNVSRSQRLTMPLYPTKRKLAYRGLTGTTRPIPTRPTPRFIFGRNRIMPTRSIFTVLSRRPITMTLTMI
jgi:hypothetical protein